MNALHVAHKGHQGQHVDWMPCLGSNGLALFSPTADQRATLGEEVFRATHFPMAMRTQEAGRLTSIVTQEQLLEQVIGAKRVGPGNRIFVLYGAAGAGKSELLRWLAVEIAQQNPARAQAMVRVSRTELDVIQIVERFHTKLSGNYFSAQTHARWEDLRSKPLTLAKLLVLSALERLLTRDDEINALFYWLASPVQRNLERGFAGAGPSNSNYPVLELFSDEDWNALTNTTELSQLLEPESLRDALATAFRNLLLENVHLPDTLRLLSEDVFQRHSVRPILLVDDLVRSLNLFAGDVMDYLITLEAGNWDAVIGVTPASLQMHTRGRQLLDRIAYLDTIDDRVQKLWLSDDFGHESYFLHEENCAEFAARYLDEYRRQNGVQCSTCAQRQRCSGMGQSSDDRLLAPFNRNALQRILRALPPGKGKARYFLKAVSEVLQLAANGADLPESLKVHAQREFLARCESPVEAAIVELYADLNDGARSVRIDSGVGDFFNLDITDYYSVELLTAQDEKRTNHASSYQPKEDPQRVAIRQWLENEAANRQLLLPLRQGVARWLRVVGAPQVINRHGIAKPHGMLRWEGRYLDVVPPIVIEGIDDAQEGVSVSRSMGLLAFDFSEFAKAKGNETRRLAAKIAESRYAGELLRSASMLRARLLQELEVQLSMPIEQFALHCYIFVLCLGREHPRMPGLPPRFWLWLQQEQLRRAAWRSAINDGMEDALVSLFEDFFRLRENVFDGALVMHLCQQITDDHWLTPLLQIQSHSVDSAFVLGDRSLAETIREIQTTVDLWLDNSNGAVLSPASQAVLNDLMVCGSNGIPLFKLTREVMSELEAVKPEVLATLKVCME